MRTWIACVTVAMSVLAGPVLGAVANPPEAIDGAITLAQRLQDDARVLRNGVRSGATVAVLDRQRGRLHASLTRLIQSHAQWAGALEVTDRQRVAAQTSEIEAGCERLRRTLVELDGVLIVPDPDRYAVRSLAQAIGAQAARCERALRAADRAIREGGHS
jgi:hypothetical protein